MATCGHFFLKGKNLVKKIDYSLKSVTHKGLKMGARLMEMETNRMNALFEFYSTLLTEKHELYGALLC